MYRFSALLIALNFICMPLYAAAGTCQNCPPLYCENPDAAQQALERKKNNARAQGTPERLIKLFDTLPNCVGCIEKTPDGFTVSWELDEDAFEDDRGYKPGATIRSMAWSADLEKKLRDDMRRGVVKEFHIVHYAGPPCSCCPDESQNAVRQWDKMQSAAGSDIPDYNVSLGFHPDAAISYTEKTDLGADPQDLTSIPSAYKRSDTLKSPPLETFMDPAVRVIQVQCDMCQKQADKYNEIGAEINAMRQPIAKIRQDIHYARQLIRDVWLEIEGLGKTAYTEQTDKKSKALYDEIGGHQRALDKYQKRLSEAVEERATLELELGETMTSIKVCEGSACVPPEEDQASCSFPEVYPAITVGPNDKVGSGAQFEKDLKNKAKGMAMGGLMGGGVSFGGSSDGDFGVGRGSSGSGQKGPKLDKDPTSGAFVDIESQDTELEIRAGYTDEGLVVSTEIDDTPGDGTFHAQWLQGADGTVYLPVRYLILELYRNWKLSVWWTHDRWVNGDHVYHDEGDSVTVGRDTLGTWKVYEGEEGMKNSIWKSLGFETAKKGVEHLGAVFDVPPEALSGPCPLQLVTHISLPKDDPVTTVPVVASLTAQGGSSADGTVKVMVTAP